MPIEILPKGQFAPLNNIRITDIISACVVIVMVVASIAFVFSLLFGGIKWILSGGKKEKADEAKAQIVNAIIGIFVVFTSWALINLVSTFFGINILEFNIPNFVSP